jgi:hypothetical protein
MRNWGRTIEICKKKKGSKGGKKDYKAMTETRFELAPHFWDQDITHT